MKILFSHDYSLFRLIKGNRNIIKKKVERIVQDVENGLNLFPYCPIIVSENDNGFMDIIDGQHRFMAAKQLDFDIYYVIAKNIQLRDIARMNSNTDKWKNEDFLKCYIQLGNIDYKKLSDFINDYKVNYSMGIELLMNGTVSSGNRSRSLNKFKDGEFQCNFIESAVNLIEISDSLFKKYNFYRDRNLIDAVYKLIKIGKWDLKVMKDKLQDFPNAMEQCTNTKNYMYLLEQIYNKRNRERKAIL